MRESFIKSFRIMGNKIVYNRPDNDTERRLDKSIRRTVFYNMNPRINDKYKTKWIEYLKIGEGEDFIAVGSCIKDTLFSSKVLEIFLNKIINKIVENPTKEIVKDFLEGATSEKIRLWKSAKSEVPVDASEASDASEKIRLWKSAKSEVPVDASEASDASEKIRLWKSAKSEVPVDASEASGASEHHFTPC